MYVYCIFTCVFIPLFARFPKCPNPVVADCKHKRNIYLTACVLWSPAISCDGCEIYLRIKMIIVNQMSILKWSVMPEKKILTYIYVHSSYP